MVRILILLIGLAAGGGAMADVFRWVDEEGVVHFSDRPHEGAEIVTLPKSQTFSAPATSRQQQPAEPETADAETDSDEEAGYTSLRIISPGQDEVLWNTGGALDVRINLEPQLQDGHKVLLFLDDQMVSELAGEQRSFQLSEVFRGTHSLRAEVHDANGDGVFRSIAITFTVQQTSVQNQNNAGGPR
jgi:hypothetical protein